MSYNAPLPPPCIRVSISNTLPVIGIDNQYTCTLAITPQPIQGGGSQYDVSTIAPGFWVSNYPFGEAWKIIQISNINLGSQTMDAVIEDVEYYNYSIDPDTGQHGPNDGAAGYCWTLAEDGLPNLFPVDPTFLTSTGNYTYVTDLINRFRSRNYYTSYVQAYQNGSTFQTGQFLTITSTGSFQVATSSSTDVYNTIAVVTSSGYPTSGYFTYRPFGEFLTYDRITPPLNAGVGSVYYINSTGGISTTAGSNSYPVYIQVSTGPTGGNGILLKGRFGQTSGGTNLPPGTSYGDYLIWNGTGSYVVQSTNVNLGANSGQYDQSGNYNVAIGYFAGATGQGFASNSFIAGATGSAIAIGNYAGANQASSAIAIGNNAGYYQKENNIAIGYAAGYNQNEVNNIAIGIYAGNTSQGTGGELHANGGNSIALGNNAGSYNQAYESIAIGLDAGLDTQGHNSIAIGISAGSTNQGNFSIAIGNNAGNLNQPSNSIILNANSSSLNASGQGLYINPIRNATGPLSLFYDPSTKEITYSTGVSGGSAGPQGFQGFQGLIGSTGAAGPQGVQGVQGFIGYQGYQGDVGPQGTQGFQGLVGFQGDVGPQGLIGSTGSQGFQGLIGYTGADGPQGFQGDIGFQGLIGHTGAEGPQGFQGLEGPQGFQGLEGPQGLIGHTGSQGPQGLIGSTGSQGIEGSQGSVGHTGSQGVQGVQGFQGDIGFQGLEGFQGLIGETGPQGFQGLIGSTGPQGIEGSQGSIGHTGAQGFQGLIGSTGSQGIQGATGAQGFQGDIGPQGLAGPTGSSGEIGFQGFQGIAGQNGLSSGLVLYMNYPNLSDQGGSLYDLSVSPTGGASQSQTTIINSIIGTGPLLPEFLTQPNINNGQTFIPPGLWDITLFASTNDITSSTSIYAQFGIFSTGGSTTLLATTNSKVINTITDDYTLTASIPYTTITLDDRIIVNLFGRTTSPSGPSITSYYLGTTYSHIVTTLFENIPTGPQGAQGFQGLAGPQGLIGHTGADGAQGFQGFIGETGPQGFQGLVGETGPQGFQGLIGETGPQGFQGLAGVQGETGPQGLVGFQGVQGYVGFQGDVGPQGLIGETGPQGFQGLIGETGPQGFQGLEGVQGATGTQGDIGFQGEQGATGTQGDIGPQGLIGETGAQGFQGIAGPTGVQGDIGPQGFQGFQGLIGETGAQGVQGVQGFQGLIGFVGATGPQGIVGFQGVQGYVGFQGDVGPQGLQGLSNMIDSVTGSFDNLFVNNLTIGTQVIMETGAYLTSTQDTFYVDANLNVSNIFTVNATTSEVEYGNYVGGDFISNVTINGVNGTIYCTGSTGAGYFNYLYVDFLTGPNLNIGGGSTGSQGPQGPQGPQGIAGPTGVIDFSTGVFDNLYVNNLTIGTQVIMETGSYLTGEGQTVFIDGHLNVSNIFTVDAISGEVQYGLEPTITMNGVNGTIYCTGSTGAGYFNYLYVDFLTGPNLNIGGGSTGAQGPQGIAGPTGVIDFSTGVFDNLYVNNLTIGTQVLMETGSYLTGEGQTVFIDGHLNVSNIFTVDATSGISSFNNYTGGQAIPTVEIDAQNGKIILQTGSYITGEGQTVFIDGNMNVSNIFTVNAVNSNVEFGNYTGGNLYTNTTINGVNGIIYCTGTSGIGYFNEINTKNIKTTFAIYTGATGSSQTARGRIYCSTGNQLFMNNSLVTENSSVFTNISRFTNPSIPSISAVETSSSYFIVYLSNTIESSPGQTIAVDWFLVN